MNTPRPHNSFFSEKIADAGNRKLLNIRTIILFLISAGYALFAFYIVKAGNSHKSPSNVSILTYYVYGLIGGGGLILISRIHSAADRTRKILTEVLEKSAEARAITNTQGETIYTNRRFNNIVSDQTENASVVSFAKIFEEPFKIEKSLDDLRIKAIPTGSATAEFHARANGQNLHFQVTCQHIVGWPGFVHWRFDDISPRYQMEAAIREEREKLRDFTDNAPVGFFSVGEDGTFLFANTTLLRFFNATTHPLIGRGRLHDFLVNPPVNARPYDCFAGGGDHQHGELLMKSLSGRVIRVNVTHSITHSTDGKVITRSIVHDLTDEHKMQQALRESEDRFQRLFEEAPVGICMLNAAGVISDVNQTLAAMLHTTPTNMDGQALASYIARDSNKKVEEWLQKLSKSEKTDQFIEVTLKGAEQMVVQLYARKFSGGDSLVLHFIDLSEQKKLEKQFTQSQKMQAVGQLAGGIAHDFNNLLTAMIGFCDLLLLRHKPGDPSFADIMQIKQNANRAANLVRQLLAFSRQQTLQPRILDLSDVLTELSHLLRRLIGANIDLRISHGTDLGLIKADQGQVEQVLINLVVNARDAMPQGGKLSVTTSNITLSQPKKISADETLPAGDWVSVTIEDTGTGIPPDVLPRIFEPFFSTKEVGAGTGLGLATVHGIVHQTGGFIDVHTTVGKGTTFTIYFPRHKDVSTDKSAPVNVAEEKAAINDLTGTSSILLVEDEDAVRVFSSRALSNKGYEVADAPSGAVALQLLEEKKIDPEILITDVMMPEMDGTALAKIVREKYPKIKIIFISGYAEDKFKEHLGENVWFLPKPFTLKQLATKVKEVIDDEDGIPGP